MDSCVEFYFGEGINVVENVLQIKTRMPPAAAGTLVRAHLAEKLEQGLLGPEGFTRFLTLVSAPAGFGKTTLVRTWLTHRKNQTAWVSLDEGDDDPNRFWTYAILALQTLDPNLGKGTRAMLQDGSGFSENTESGQSILTPLLNDLISLTEPLFLVLDDWHAISSTRIHDGLVFFAENIPPWVHLVVTTRSDPPWPLSRWRARGNLLEVRQEDLQFDREETAEFLSGISGRTLQDQQIRILYEKTEGWATGLQLVGVSLQGADNPDSLIRSFAGTHRHILHFLTDEVLSRQEDAVRSFLLMTSVLDRFCAALCDAVMERDDSIRLIRFLEENNLFVVGLDEQGVWYRFHRFFQDLLHHHLRQSKLGDEEILNARASAWFLEHGDFGAAVHHAQAAGNPDRVGRILDRYFHPVMLEVGAHALHRLLEELPEDTLQKFPRLAAHKGYHRLIQHGQEEAAQVIAFAEGLSLDDAYEQAEYQGMLHVLKAYDAIFSHDMARAVEHASTALKTLQSESTYWRNGVNIISGDASLFSGNPRKAYPYYREAYQNSRGEQNLYQYIASGFKTATALLFQGALNEAERITRTLIQEGEEGGLAEAPRLGLLWVLLGELKRESSHLYEAEKLMDRGLAMSEPEKPSQAWNCLFRIRLAHSMQDLQKARQILDRIAELHGEATLPGFILLPAAAWKARLALEEDNPRAARAILHEAGIHEAERPAGGQEAGYLTLARILLVGSEAADLVAADTILKELTTLSAAGEYCPVLIPALLLQAALYARLQKHATAEAILLRALATGKQQGYQQIFLDEGAGLGDEFHKLFHSMVQGGFPKNPDLAEYAARIQGDLSELRKTAQPQEDPDQRVGLKPGLVEDLSSRELGILEMIARGLSNRDIADKLFLSTGTIKWHTSNIYGKLGVRGRAQAVAKAMEIGLLDGNPDRSE